ncbi:disulfide bond formation protein B [Sutterella sp.]|uniref:disulfide bond formation protein DsbI n=1 Tax=Sutterella sp. TaxID=1981025 RepID=UPI0026DFE45D|nr:disulfide bond formation protein B [Sutterella sp.]MDO5531671.1 disulfide bond formation protein B [Sutterella sp.]
MTDYAQPVNENDIRRAKTWYDIVCWGGLLIVLLPVGIANVVLGYFLGDSPCTLCWGQRQQMAYIGVVALFMVRYGFKPKYLATMLVMAACGLYSSFRHFGNHAARDIGQGFGLDIFGIHTQFWAEIVFWCVVMLFGLACYFAPRFDALIAEMKGKPFRPLSTFNKWAVIIVAAIVGSNCFQALWSTGVPPNWGQGSPVRFSFNPKYVVWSDASWHGMWAGINFLGKRDVKDPDFAYKPNTAKLGLTWDHNADNAPVALTGKLTEKSVREIQGIDAAVNMMSSVRGQRFVASKYDFWVLDESLKPVVAASMDPWFDVNVLDIVGITPYGKDAFVIMGMNKSLLRARLNPEADDVKGWANFTAGRDQVEAVGGFGRARIDTERAKFSYVHASATDGRYIFTATVPDNKNKKTFVISKALMSDWMLSGEFIPAADLKEGRTLGELYVTGMVWEDGTLWAVSKNFNLLVSIDVAAEKVTGAWGLPAQFEDIRGLVKTGNTIEVVDRNRVVTFELP